MSITILGSVAATLPEALYECCKFTDEEGEVLTGEIDSSSFTSSEIYSVSGNGSCQLTASASSNCGCPNSIPVTQSVDLCDLALSAYLQLAPESLNMFGAPCN